MRPAHPCDSAELCNRDSFDSKLVGDLGDRAYDTAALVPATKLSERGALADGIPLSPLPPPFTGTKDMSYIEDFYLETRSSKIPSACLGRPP
jgi:hypothetical protein